MVDSGDSVEASDSEDHVIDDLDGEVAARVVHVGHGSPRVGRRVVHLAAAHPRDAVETANHVNLNKKEVFFMEEELRERK